MDFTGRLYYDLIDPGVFRMYRLFAAADGAGARIAVEWRAFPASPDTPDRRALAAAELAMVHSPGRVGGFLQAALVAVHMDGMDPGDPDLITLAGKVAGIGSDVLASDLIDTEGAQRLTATEAEARELGVSTVPTIYRHGPVMVIKTTPAAAFGDAIERLRVIDAVLDDDGIWELAKP